MYYLFKKDKSWPAKIFEWVTVMVNLEIVFSKMRKKQFFTPKVCVSILKKSSNLIRVIGFVWKEESSFKKIS